MNNNEYLVGVYKEVGKTPDIIKIKNQKDYLERLVDGEYTNIDYDNYTIIYKKNSNNLLSNIYVDQYSKIGISLKGKIFAVGKDEKGNFKSLTKDQAKKCISFFLRESFNYKNFDEKGRYIPRSQRKKNKKTARYACCLFIYWAGWLCSYLSRRKYIRPPGHLCFTRLIPCWALRMM